MTALVAIISPIYLMHVLISPQIYSTKLNKFDDIGNIIFSKLLEICTQ